MKLKVGKKTGLKYFNINYIRSLGPCYDPSRYLKEDFKGTVIDILNNDNIPFHDRLWVVLRTELISEKCMRLFAVWSARQVLRFNSDERLVKTLDVVEKYANGLATENELSAAESAARSAAWAAAESARSAESAAESAAWSAAWSAAESAAWSASRSAAWSAESAARSAESAARSAARSAAESAAWSARSAAWSEAESAESAKSTQKEKLIEMVKTEGLEYVKNKKKVV